MNSIQSLIRYQLQRYKNKGIKNSIVALSLLLTFHLSLFYFVKHLWDPNIQRKRFFAFIWGCLVHTFTVLFCFAIYSQSYLFKLPWIQKYRIQPNKKWHWDRSNWSQLKVKTLKTLLTVHFIYFPLGLMIGLIQMKLNFTFPSLTEHSCHLLFCLLMEDTFFYWTHRTLHNYPFLYQKIHKKHHEYDSPFANAAEYAHPIQYIFGNMIPAASGIIILGSRLHVFTYLVFIFVRIMNTEQAHSGIDIPWSPIRVLLFATPSSFHNFHHSKNSGTYGSLFYLWDFLTKTGESYFHYRPAPISKE